MDTNNVKNIYLKDKMKIGVVGISGKGKTTFLNHLIDEQVANELVGLIGPDHREGARSGQTKNPVRYNVKLVAEKCLCKVRRLVDKESEEAEIELSEVAGFATDEVKCTVIIEAPPSVEFEKIMNEYALTELEFIDTQGLLDTLNKEVNVPHEIRECAFLLYLYDRTDIVCRDDFKEKYKNYLYSISDKPLIFLECDTQWQLSIDNLDNLTSTAEEILRGLDASFSTGAEDIRIRYMNITGNSEYNNNEAFILTSILGAAESSVNFYEVKIAGGRKGEVFEQCLRLCSAHVMEVVFARLAGVNDSLKKELDNFNAKFDYSVAFNACYGLLHDIFVHDWGRINNPSAARVQRHARHKYGNFTAALEALQKGDLLKVDFYKKDIRVSEHGNCFSVEIYKDQKFLDCMQLLLDLYVGYLKRLDPNGSKLSKAMQVYAEKSIVSENACRDTGYVVPVLKGSLFWECYSELKSAIGEISVDSVVFIHYDEQDIDYPYKKGIISCCEESIGKGRAKSLMTKLVCLCDILNAKVYNTATDSLLDKVTGFVK